MGVVRWLRWFFWLEPDPIDPVQTAVEQTAASPPDPELELFVALTRRMGYLGADAGADERERILSTAPSLVHGLLMEEAGRQAAMALRSLGPGRPHGEADAAEIRARALEAECFHAAQTGYVLAVVAAPSTTATATPTVAPTARRPSMPAGRGSAAQQWAPRLHGRARRLRAALPRPVRRWMQLWTAGVRHRLAARGWTPPLRAVTVLAPAVEALLACGYAAARETADGRRTGNLTFASRPGPEL